LSQPHRIFLLCTLGLPAFLVFLKVFLLVGLIKVFIKAGFFRHLLIFNFYPYLIHPKSLINDSNNFYLLSTNQTVFFTLAPKDPKLSLKPTLFFKAAALFSHSLTLKSDTAHANFANSPRILTFSLLHLFISLVFKSKSLAVYETAFPLVKKGATFTLKTFSVKPNSSCLNESPLSKAKTIHLSITFFNPNPLIKPSSQATLSLTRFPRLLNEKTPSQNPLTSSTTCPCSNSPPSCLYATPRPLNPTSESLLDSFQHPTPTSLTSSNSHATASKNLRAPLPITYKRSSALTSSIPNLLNYLEIFSNPFSHEK
jgi:hypothetical protein